MASATMREQAHCERVMGEMFLVVQVTALLFGSAAIISRRGKSFEISIYETL